MKVQKGRTTDMRIITINIPDKFCLFIDKCVQWGLIPSRSEYIRHATELKLKKDMKFIETLNKEIESYDPTKFVRVPGYNGEKLMKILRRLE